MNDKQLKHLDTFNQNSNDPQRKRGRHARYIYACECNDGAINVGQTQTPVNRRRVQMNGDEYVPGRKEPFRQSSFIKKHGGFKRWIIDMFPVGDLTFDECEVIETDLTDVFKSIKGDNMASGGKYDRRFIK